VVLRSHFMQGAFFSKKVCAW